MCKDYKEIALESEIRDLKKIVQSQKTIIQELKEEIEQMKFISPVKVPDIIGQLEQQRLRDE
jgi:predicted RNase H-like nuclease (RuvC/YqgF family)